MPNYHLQADICQLGLDQRKVNVLAREYCDQCKPKRKLKPVILSHEMMPGLLQVKLLFFLFTRRNPLFPVYFTLGVTQVDGSSNGSTCP